MAANGTLAQGQRLSPPGSTLTAVKIAVLRWAATNKRARTLFSKWGGDDAKKSRGVCGAEKEEGVSAAEKLRKKTTKRVMGRRGEV